MLEARQLSYTLAGKHLIQNISLRFLPGRLYGILGPNGSGKSTLLKTLTGIWRPTSGIVLWKSENLLCKPRDQISRTMSLVPESVRISFDFTVTDIVAMGRYAHNDLHRSDAKDRLEAALKKADAWHLRESSILKISQGERKRVYIARALMSASPILLLDEPCANLDIKHQLEIWELLRNLARTGKIIIAANHNLAATERFCDETAVINCGKLAANGTCSELFSDRLLAEVFGVQKTPSGWSYCITHLTH